MLIITNRNLIKQINTNKKRTKTHTFGDEIGQNVYFAKAKKKNSVWKLTSLQEFNHENFLQTLESFIEEAKKEGKNLVFFVHGNNQSFKKNLDKCQKIEKIHGVKVIAFSWPSQPFKSQGWLDLKNKKKNYKKARKNAKNSETIKALAKTLDILQKCLDKNTEISFMAHSLGCYLYQYYLLLNNKYNSPRFNNVILCQADTDIGGHGIWVKKILTFVSDTVYITINSNDGALPWAEFVIPSLPGPRLGQRVPDKNERSNHAIYVDFTAGDTESFTKHDLFLVRQWKYPPIEKFFTDVLNGNQCYLTSSKKFIEKKDKYYEIKPCVQIRPR